MDFIVDFIGSTLYALSLLVLPYIIIVLSFVWFKLIVGIFLISLVEKDKRSILHGSLEILKEVLPLVIHVAVALAILHIGGVWLGS